MRLISSEYTMPDALAFLPEGHHVLMIYSDDFVWLHFPKCAGTKIERLFEKYFFDVQGIVQDAVGIKKDPLIKWHDSVAGRENRDFNFKLGSRTVIFPIRKLPCWLESRYNFEVARTPDRRFEPELLLEGKFFRSNGSVVHADTLIKNFLPENILNSKQLEFIRMEHFERDFKEVFGKYIDIEKIPEEEYFKKVNASKSYIPENIRLQLYNSGSNLYELCPYWKRVEKLAYNVE